MEMFDDRLLSEKARSRHRLIGQVFDTYWLVEYNGSLYIIDQHAAHEKVLFEKTFLALKVQGIYLPAHQPSHYPDPFHAGGGAIKEAHGCLYQGGL